MIVGYSERELGIYADRWMDVYLNKWVDSYQTGLKAITDYQGVKPRCASVADGTPLFRRLSARHLAAGVLTYIRREARHWRLLCTCLPHGHQQGGCRSLTMQS